MSPAWDAVQWGVKPHQLMLRLHLGHTLSASLVLLLQLGHHSLALFTQDLLVFDQLCWGPEVRWLHKAPAQQDP